MGSNLKGAELVQAKVDMMCQMIVDKVHVGVAAKRIHKHFGTGMTWEMYYGLADGTYGYSTGRAAQFYRDRWAAKIAELPEECRRIRPKQRAALPAVTKPATNNLCNQIAALVGQHFGIDASKIREVRATQDNMIVITEDAWAKGTAFTNA